MHQASKTLHDMRLTLSWRICPPRWGEELETMVFYEKPPPCKHPNPPPSRGMELSHCFQKTFTLSVKAQKCG